MIKCTFIHKIQYLNLFYQDGTHSPDITIIRDGGDIHHRRNRHRQRNNIETLDERVHSHRNKLLPSVHFDGDTSKYVLGRHTNFNGKY